eukprot:6473656-Amphidinium_carterae.5
MEEVEPPAPPPELALGIDVFVQKKSRPQPRQRVLSLALCYYAGNLARCCGGPVALAHPQRGRRFTWRFPSRGTGKPWPTTVSSSCSALNQDVAAGGCSLKTCLGCASTQTDQW